MWQFFLLPDEKGPNSCALYRDARELIVQGGRTSLKKSHKIVLLIIGILIMLVASVVGLKRAFQLGQRQATNPQTNQRAK
jgi:hypothetical protein